MGYSYGRTASGAYALACDGCGDVGGVRKRTCPHKVLGDSIRSTSDYRHALPWCPAPALCQACLTRHGGLSKLHAGCKASAAAAQAGYDADEALFQTGEPIRISAIRCDAPHEQWTRVTFAKRLPDGTRVQLERFVDGEEYRSLGYGRAVGLSAYTTAVPELPAAVTA